MSQEDARSAVVTYLIGASYGVDVMSAAQGGWTFPIPIEELTALCDNRLELRYLLRGADPGTQHLLDTNLRHVVGDRWQIRITTPDHPSANCIVIDREVIFMTEAFPLKKSLDVILITEPVKVNAIAGRFERLWERSTEADREYFFFEDEFECLSAEKTQSIRIVSKEFWDGLIRGLAAKPEALYSISPRTFEELIAELLRREGMKTVLTPPTRDGGRDVLVMSSSVIGELLFLVECKRYAPNRPVDVSIVRELFGVLGHERATGALIATTSYFTEAALKFRKPIQYQMGFKDYDAIRTWLARAASLKSNA